MNTHLQREYNLTLIAMKAQGYAAMLNYYYTLWNFYLACQNLCSTAELTNVKLSGRHFFPYLNNTFTTCNKIFALSPTRFLCILLNNVDHVATAGLMQRVHIFWLPPLPELGLSLDMLQNPLQYS